MHTTGVYYGQQWRCHEEQCPHQRSHWQMSWGSSACEIQYCGRGLHSSVQCPLEGSSPLETGGWWGGSSLTLLRKSLQSFASGSEAGFISACARLLGFSFTSQPCSYLQVLRDVQPCQPSLLLSCVPVSTAALGEGSSNGVPMAVPPGCSGMDAQWQHFWYQASFPWKIFMKHWARLEA